MAPGQEPAAPGMLPGDAVPLRASHSLYQPKGTKEGPDLIQPGRIKQDQKTSVFFQFIGSFPFPASKKLNRSNLI